VPLPANIIAIQNHDQVGNRAKGERLTALVPRGVRKALAAVLLLAPHTPLIFMGQEFDEAVPFQFFTDYGDPVLQRAVSEGRRKEFKDFDFSEVPDPQDTATFERSRLNWGNANEANEMLRWYRALLDLRSELVLPGERTCRAQLEHGDAALHMRVPRDNPRLLLQCALQAGAALPATSSGWKLRLKSEEDGYAVRVWSR